MAHTIGGLAPVGVSIALAWIFVGLAELASDSRWRLGCYVLSAGVLPLGAAMQFASYKQLLSGSMLPVAIAAVLFVAGWSALLFRAHATVAARQRTATYSLIQRLLRLVAPFILMAGVILLATAVLSLHLSAQTGALLNGAVVVGFIIASIGFAARGVGVRRRGQMPGPTARHVRLSRRERATIVGAPLIAGTFMLVEVTRWQTASLAERALTSSVAAVLLAVAAVALYRAGLFSGS